VAVYVAQVPLVYQVPALIKHPVWLPLVNPFRYPFPESVPLPPVGLELALDEVVLVVIVVRVVDEVDCWLLDEVDEVETGLPDFGRYLIPVDEQLEVCPTGSVGTNVPVCTEPCTS
jgi:hypothetical protein